MSRFQNNPWYGTVSWVTEYLSINNPAKRESNLILAHFRPGLSEMFNLTVCETVDFQLRFIGNAFLLDDWPIYQQIN